MELSIVQNSQNVKSMTSQQIAELLETRHDTVKRSIERIADRGVISKPPMEDGIKAANGVVTKVYVFTGDQGERDSIIVVAQLSPEFTGKIVDRWRELEAELSSPVAPVFQIPQTLSEALQLAANQAKQIELAAPKVAHYDAVVERGGLLNATQVGSKVGKSAVALNKILLELGVYNKAVKRSKVFNKGFIDKGFGVVKQTEMGHTQSLFTLKGEAWVIEKLACESAV